MKTFRRTLALVLTAAMAFSFILSGAVNAAPDATDITAYEANPESDFTFDSTTGTITAYTGTSYDVVIPDSIGGDPVVAIGAAAFAGRSLTSVIIPDTVATIGAGAFAVNNLTSVVIPESVTAIGTGVFTSNQLTYVVIPNSVTSIGQLAFRYNNLLTVRIPAGCFYYTGTDASFDSTVTIIERAEEAVSVLAGADRYATAVEISKASFETTTTAIIALGTNFPDALAGGSLAVQVNAPILLAKKDSLPDVTSAELTRLGVTDVIILGSTAAISSVVADEIEDMGITVNRVFGADRYATAVEIARLVRDYSGVVDTVVIASGENFPDALSIGSYAAMEGIPVLLTKANTLPKATADALEEFGITNVIVAGGAAAVNETVTEAIEDMGIVVTGVAGSDRYSTGIAVAELYFSDAQIAVISCGTNFPDALAAVPFAARLNAPILLVRPTSIPDSVAEFIKGSVIQEFVVVGGDPAVSAGVRTTLDAMLTE